MVFLVQDETLLDYHKIQSTILCWRGCLEENVSLTPELVPYSGPVVHSEVDVDFAVYYNFSESKY